jgi:hypothetical protein
VSALETKIANLLAKAESTNHPAEAEAFMAKAEELMLKHGIERATLEAGRPGQRREDIVQVRMYVKNGHGYATAMSKVAHAVAPSFSVTSLKSSMPDGGQIIWFIGHKSDVEQAQALASSLMEQSRKQALHWWKTEGKHDYGYRGYHTDNDAYLARREFIFAFASGVRSRLEETRSRVVEESGTGTALVLVERQTLVDNWIAENMKVGKGRASNRNHGGYAAAKAGKQAGREAIGTKQVTR